ncbi:MAG: alpha/beta hydrolase [Cyanobacteria bacterium P01_D01_bin.36]
MALGKRINTTKHRILSVCCVLGLSYLSFCLFFRFYQRQLIYRPHSKITLRPSAPDFNLSYTDVWIPVQGTSEQLHGWWLPATANKTVTVLPQEPQSVLTEPKVILYFCGVGRNMSDYNYLSRASAFRQLGFSVLMFDYRGYGKSDGSFPAEAQLYEDSEAAWRFLRNHLKVPAEKIIIYGESLGGAIALNLATQHPEAAALIMQSSFTTMSNAVKSKPLSTLVPVDFILTEQFDSRSKITQLEMPVLFIHGRTDSVVPVSMSETLYSLAPQPKQKLIIPEADHVSIYKEGQYSYLRAIEKFMLSLP